MNWKRHIDGDVPTKKNGTLKVLSIDGGGIKGVIPSVYLSRIEDELGEPIESYFDLITGTSTGGIIALGLASGIPASEIASLYYNKRKKIFPKRLNSNLLFSAKYKSNNLQAILKDAFGEIKINDAKTMLCIPSIEHHKAEPKVYKTPHHKDFTFDSKRYMWEVGLATSAAPMYFPAISIGESEVKIDGGLWANNPVLVGIAEGKKIGFAIDQLKVLSLGTGESLYNVNNKIAKKGGIFNWKTNIIDFTFQVQSKAATHTANYLLEDNLRRISPILSRTLKLDSTNKNDMNYMVREANASFEQTFIKRDIKDIFFN